MTEVTVDMDEARRDLAAIFRWTVRQNMHEAFPTISPMPFRMTGRYS